MYIVYNNSVMRNTCSIQCLNCKIDSYLHINLHMHVFSNITNIKNYRKTKAQLR